MKTSKTRQSLLGLLLCCGLVLLLPTHTLADAGREDGPGNELVFLNWSDYMDPALLEKFERLHGITVKEVYFHSDDHRDAILAMSESKGYDLVILDGAMLATYSKIGWLAAIPTPAPANLAHIGQEWKETFVGKANNAVPLLWGTLGIAYRSDLVAAPVTSWNDIFKPDASMQQRIGMIGSVRELFGMALKSQGYSINSTDSGQIQRAAAVLKAQSKAVNTYIYSDLHDQAPLVIGEIAASMMYSGDALTLREFNPAIEFVLPAEGGSVWVDHLAVLAASPRQANAWKFINFLCEPENAAQLAQYLFTATTNVTAANYLPDSFLEDPIINPGSAERARYESIEPLPPRVLNKINSLVVPIIQQQREADS